MITFTKQPNKTLENAFNNQVFEFYAENGMSCKVLISDGTITREINIDAMSGAFYMNAKSSVLSIFNTNNFADVVVPTIISFLINDASLFRSIAYSFTVSYLNGTTENVVITKLYSKAVDNLLKPLAVENAVFRPFLNNTYINCYEGLPFDITFYSNIARSVVITNKRTGLSVTKSFTAGVNRLFFSNGENNKGFELELPLVVGVINQLEFVSGSLLCTLEVFKHAECEAPYLKWFNSRGGWSYFRFSKVYQEGLSASNNDFLNNDFDNIETTVSNFQATGKTASNSLALDSDILQANEIDNFVDIFTSPKVFYYATGQNQPMTLYSFKEVSLNSSAIELRNSKFDTHRYDVTIELPSYNTQTYV